MKNFFIKTGENAQRQNKLIKKVLFASIAIALIFVFGIFFFIKRSPLPSYRADQIPISFEGLMPEVTHAQARANICGKMNGGFYDKVCASGFDNVSLNDDEKIITLLSLFQTIANDSVVSDYDRYFLGHLLFASLPTKDGAVSRMPDFLEMAGKLLAHIIAIPAIAQTKSTQPADMRGFSEQLARDFVSTLYDLPDGDNAWVINVMVSKYRWVDGKRQPVYSEQYTESFNPFPVNPLVNDGDITYHLRSFMDSKSVTIDESNVLPPYQGTAGVMMAYSFNIMSWNSPSYGHDETIPEEKLQTRKNFSEVGYDGTSHLDELFDTKARLEESSNKVTRKRNAALEDRRNFNANNRRVQTRPRGESPSSDQPIDKERPSSDLGGQACLDKCEADFNDCERDQKNESEKLQTAYRAAYDAADACSLVCLDDWGKTNDVCTKTKYACWREILDRKNSDGTWKCQNLLGTFSACETEGQANCDAPEKVCLDNASKTYEACVDSCGFPDIKAYTVSNSYTCYEKQSACSDGCGQGESGGGNSSAPSGWIESR